MKLFFRNGRGMLPQAGRGSYFLPVKKYAKTSSLKPFDTMVVCHTAIVKSFVGDTFRKCEVMLRTFNSNPVLSRYKIGTSSAILIIFCLLFCQAVVLPAFGQGATGLTTVQTLKVGDAIPAELWDLPLQVVHHPEGKDFIKLSDYRDKKLIILDFWGTWCSSCIEGFPQAKLIQDQFEKDIVFISIAGQPAPAVRDFISTNEIAREVALWSVVEDKSFNDAIVKYTLPHYTWIADKKVISNTTGAALTPDYISQYLSTGQIHWVEKVNLNKKAPFYTSLGDLPTSASSYYYEGNLGGAGKIFGSLPFGHGRTNYHFINFTKQEIFEWFIQKINRMHGNPVQAIKYSQTFVAGKDWSAFTRSPISLQVITGRDRSLESVFKQVQAMSSSFLVRDSEGRYTIQAEGGEGAL